jgi:hypothetical protein
MDLSTPNTTGADTLVINLSQDAWQGDARFTVAVDGQQVGDEFSAATLHGQGSDTLTLHGDWVGGAHDLAITFINDAYDGTPDTDRNLYVDGITLNGNAVPDATAGMFSAGTVTFGFGGDTQQHVESPAPVPVDQAAPGAWREVWHESFDNGTGMFSRSWGPGVDTSVPGQLTIRTSADDQDSGAMVPPWGSPDAGYGYGLYSFTLKTQGTVGTYALTWPGTDRWPGPELDLMEITNEGVPYTTIHWKGQDGSNQFKSYTLDGVNPAETHTYAMNWQHDFIDIYVDGTLKHHITENVPHDYAHGGENTAPGIGTQTWWNGGALGGNNWITLYEASYSVLA